MKLNYNEFLEKKLLTIPDSGIKNIGTIHPILFEFQKDIVRWSLKKGKSAIFSMTGTGKTLMQCEWARHVFNETNGNILIFAPLAVSHQTVREAKKLDLRITYCKSQEDVKKGINITNYERLNKFNSNNFTGIVLDESSILKSLTGKTKDILIEKFLKTPFKLACTATPAPNDFMELGNHSEFLNILSYSEMLSMFFVHDGGDTARWRLKKHAMESYWNWIANWAVVLTKPSDLNYNDEGFTLPPLNIEHIKVKSNHKPKKGYLFALPAETLRERQKSRIESIDEKIIECKKIVEQSDETCLIWCNYNTESDKLKKYIKNSTEIRGSHDLDYKEKTMLGFSTGKIKILITKPSIAGFGMNWQHCSKIIFFGLSDSFEQYFQAVRRCWRFGQKKPVDVYIITSELESNVIKNINRKESNAKQLLTEMVERTRNTVINNLHSNSWNRSKYEPNKEMEIPKWLK